MEHRQENDHRLSLPGGGEVFVFDDLITERLSIHLYDELRKQPYRNIEADRPERAEVLHWVRNFKPDNPEDWKLCGIYVELAQQLCIECELQRDGLDRVYANLNLYGDIQFSHRDGDCYTVLFFANSNWLEEWDGELLLYGDAGHALAIRPKPGRAVVFDGMRLHRGGIPSKLCLEPRITVAVKFNKSR